MVVRVVSLICQLPFIPQEDSWYFFLLDANRPQGYSMAGRIRSIETFSDLIRNQTHDLPACSIVPQTTTLLYGAVIRTHNIQKVLKYVIFMPNF
jgi:hypothetical protein